MIQSTACKKCANKACSNKIESHWKDRDGNVHFIEDCAPKRTLLLQQETCNRLIGLQGAIEELRNEVSQLGTLRQSIDEIVQTTDKIAQHADLVAYVEAQPVKETRDDLRSLPHRVV